MISDRTVVPALAGSRLAPRGVAIRARGLEKAFDRGLVPVLRGVDLEVGAGERAAIMGPTGCGKSTLLALLALLDRPDAGELELDGRPAASIGDREGWRAANLGIVFQAHHLLPHLTVEENLLLACLGRERRVARRLAAARLDELGLGVRRAARAATLSGGERQLAALARALVNEPRLILADEPTGSVDSATGARIVASLLEWSAARKATLLVVTHDAAVAGAMEHTMQMRDGRILAGGGGLPPASV